MKRPKTLLFLTSVYLVAPVAILVINSMLNMVSLIGTGSIWTKLSLPDYLALCLYPVIAFSIYKVRPVSWWLFIGGNSFLLLHNLVAFIRNPMISVAALLFSEALLFGVAGYFFRKEVIAPYFNPRLRFWEQEDRLIYDFSVQFHTEGEPVNGFISDLSRGGCYVYIPKALLKDQLLQLSIRSPVFSITLPVQIMRIHRFPSGAAGVGVRFTEMTPLQTQGVILFIRKLQKAFPQWSEKVQRKDERRQFYRFALDFGLTVDFQGHEVHCSLLDLSKSGCCIRVPFPLKIGDSLQLRFSIQDQRQSTVNCQVRWLSNDHGSMIAGVCFLDISREVLDIRKMLKKLKVPVREPCIKDVHALINQSIDKTPYIVVKKVKGFIRREIKPRT